MSDISQQIIDVTSTDSGEAMAVSVTYPDDGQWHPTIAMIMDAPGMRESLYEFARRLAGEGYRVVLPDLHHRHGRLLGWEANELTPEAREKLGQVFNAMTDAGIQQDLDDALAAIELTDDEKLGTIGFCLGARAIYRTLMRLPDRFAVGATWHPSMLHTEPDPPYATAANLKQPLYIGIGTADQVQSIEMQQPFFDAVADLDHVEVMMFEGADHGFTWPTSPNYHEEAATVSWAKTTALFAANLPQ